MDFKHKIEKCFIFFPLGHLMICAYLAWDLLTNPKVLTLGVLLFVIYLLPIVLYRLSELISQTQQGTSYVGDKGWSPWLIGFRLQSLYIYFPFLESILRIFPPIYSFWLRLWGSKIGKNVFWSPTMDITDRGHLEIGDEVLFGHRVILLSHVITPKDGRKLLYVKNIKMGNKTFIGAGCRFGPGTDLADGTLVKTLTDYGVNNKILSKINSIGAQE
jgi:acetyltransferase-like isoleucine patch superfamily enzyme